MPRQLLRDGRVVADDWRYLAETGLSDAPPEVASESPTADRDVAQADAPSRTEADASLILPLDRWITERERWSEYRGRLGVTLGPAHKVETIVADLARFQLIAAEFSGPSEGRGYTQGRMLRERWNFSGELRAIGYVRRDQVFFLARCGFNSFEIPQRELAGITRAFHTFSAEYQPTNDRGLAHALNHRRR